MKQPLVVGYKGEIGSFILNGLLKIMPKALDIWCIDINESEVEIRERIIASDVIFLCVPLECTFNWLQKYKFLLFKDKIIVEQCSLKETLLKNKRLSCLDIRSMHILFRPSQTPNLEDRKVGLFAKQFSALAPVTSEQIAAMTQSKIVWFENASEHDSEMAIQQGLLHRMLLTLGKQLKTCNSSTYISKRVMELSDRIKKGDLNLYKQIQENKYLPAALQKMRKDLENFDIEDYWPKLEKEKK